MMATDIVIDNDLHDLLMSLEGDSLIANETFSNNYYDNNISYTSNIISPYPYDNDYYQENKRVKYTYDIENTNVVTNYSNNNNYSANHNKVVVIPKSIPLSSYFNFPNRLCEAFNRGDLKGLQNVIKSFLYTSCIFRLDDSFSIRRSTGNESIVKYFSVLLDKYPDGIIGVNRVTSNEDRDIKVIKAYLNFSGTMVLNGNKIVGINEEIMKESKSIPLPSYTVTNLESNKKKFIRVYAQTRLKLYIENNKIVLFDNNSKYSSKEIFIINV
mmetsp:Transcript_13304/g.12058  ORF Transcript_13304/g.12058 Transcript_13304/m.12058 type:complete len:270 (+) Transcript_13304:32-841(+)